MSDGQLDRTMARAVGRRMARREKMAIHYVEIDAKAMRKGHRYVFILSDISDGVVIDLEEGQDGVAAEQLWKRLLTRWLFRMHN